MSDTKKPLKSILFAVTDEELAKTSEALHTGVSSALTLAGAFQDEELAHLVNVDSSLRFSLLITQMNETYGLPINEFPSLDINEPVATRVDKFVATMQKELGEVEEIHEVLHLMESGAASELDVLTKLADWLGDLVVYVSSEARKFGIPMPPVLDTIMGSNFTKLGEDGKPIIDPVLGKFNKGPNFVPPEKLLAHLLGSIAAEYQAAQESGCDCEHCTCTKPCTPTGTPGSHLH